MATSTSSHPSTTTNTHDASTSSHQPTEFEHRRAALVGQIGESLESVLTQINALNRSLEGIIEIGNEFASVEALWSQFETVMGMSPENAGNDNANQDEQGDTDQDGGARDSRDKKS